jgi:hypothetical protein
MLIVFKQGHVLTPYPEPLAFLAGAFLIFISTQANVFMDHECTVVTANMHGCTCW